MVSLKNEWNSIYNTRLLNGFKKRCKQCLNVSEESNFHGPYPLNSLYHFIIQFSSVQLLSHVQLSATPWTAARQATLFIANSESLLRLMSIESVMPSNHLILYCPRLLLPSIFPSVIIQWSHKICINSGINNAKDIRLYFPESAGSTTLTEKEWLNK